MQGGMSCLKPTHMPSFQAVYVDPGCHRKDRLLKCLQQERYKVLEEPNATGYLHIIPFNPDDPLGMLPLIRQLTRGAILICEDAILPQEDFKRSSSLSERISITKTTFLDKVICCTGLKSELKCLLEVLVRSMGGKYRRDLGQSVTHLVGRCSSTPKYKGALDIGIHTVTVSWVFGSFATGVCAKEEDHTIGALAGTRVCVTGIKIEDRPLVREQVEQNGGEYVRNLGEATNILISATPVDSKSAKIQFAFESGIPVVGIEWLEAKVKGRGRPGIFLDFLLLQDQISKMRNTETAGQRPLRQYVGNCESEKNVMGGGFSFCAGVGLEKVGDPVEYEEENDTYLEMVQASLLGLPQRLLSRLQAIIIAGGGTYLENRLSPGVTHVVSTSPQAIRQFLNGKGEDHGHWGEGWGSEGGVGVGWLEACYREKNMVDIEPYLLRKPLRPASNNPVPRKPVEVENLPPRKPVGWENFRKAGGHKARNPEAKKPRILPDTELIEEEDISMFTVPGVPGNLGSQSRHSPSSKRQSKEEDEDAEQGEINFSSFLKSLNNNSSKFKHNSSTNSISKPQTLSQRLTAQRLGTHGTQKRRQAGIQGRKRLESQGQQLIVSTKSNTGSSLKERLQKRQRLRRSASAMSGSVLTNSSKLCTRDSASRSRPVHFPFKSASFSHRSEMPMRAQEKKEVKKEALNIFSGLKFALAQTKSFSLQTRLSLSERIKSLGGTLIDIPKGRTKDKSSIPPDYIVGVDFPIRLRYMCHSNPNAEECAAGRALIPVAVTPKWLEACQKRGAMVHPGESYEYLAFPTQRELSTDWKRNHHKGLRGMKGVSLTVSGFRKAERKAICKYVEACGGGYSEKLRHKMTHLVCKTASGAKFKKAQKWKTPTVSAAWLCDSLRTQRPLPPQHYLITSIPTPPSSSAGNPNGDPVEFSQLSNGTHTTLNTHATHATRGTNAPNPVISDPNPVIHDPNTLDTPAVTKRENTDIPEETPGILKETPRISEETPGILDETPGIPEKTPGIPEKTPGNLEKTPGNPEETPGIPKEMPGIPENCVSEELENMFENAITTAIETTDKLSSTKRRQSGQVAGAGGAVGDIHIGGRLRRRKRQKTWQEIQDEDSSLLKSSRTRRRKTGGRKRAVSTPRGGAAGEDSDSSDAVTVARRRVTGGMAAERKRLMQEERRKERIEKGKDKVFAMFKVKRELAERAGRLLRDEMGCQVVDAQKEPHGEWTHFVTPTLNKKLPVVLAIMNPRLTLLNEQYLTQCCEEGDLADEEKYDWAKAVGASAAQARIIRSIVKWKGLSKTQRRRSTRRSRTKKDDSKSKLPFTTWVACLLGGTKKNRALHKAILTHGGACVLDTVEPFMTHCFFDASNYGLGSPSKTELKLTKLHRDMIRESEAKCLHANYISDFVVSSGDVDSQSYLIEILET